jgi:hypothetical protein
MFADATQMEACHWLLLRTSGWAADDVIARCRIWLSQGRVRAVARTIAHAAIAQRLRLTEPDLDLLVELLAADGTDTSALEMLDITDLDPLPHFGFAPTRWLAKSGRIPAADTRTACVSGEPKGEADRAVVRAASGHPLVRAVWRAWRFCGHAAWPPPRRVYVLETDPGADLPAIAAGTQEASRRVGGEPHPQIEVYPGAGPSRVIGLDPAYRELPSYQRLARDHGALLWARRPDPGIQRLNMFESHDRLHLITPLPTVLDNDEYNELLMYLRRGVPVALTPAMATDVYNPEYPPAVPMNYRTDGFWLWSDANTYYLERYPVRPDPRFIADVRARGYKYSDVDGAALHRARAVLLTT